MKMKTNHEPEGAILDATNNESDGDLFFRPLTAEIVADRLENMWTRWYDRTDRAFDLEDEFEDWMMPQVIDAIRKGGLDLSKN